MGSKLRSILAGTAIGLGALTSTAQAQEPTRAELRHFRHTTEVTRPRVLHTNGTVDTVSYNPRRPNDDYVLDVVPDGHVHASNDQARERIKDGKFNVASLQGRTIYMTGEACRGEHRPITRYVVSEDCAPIALYLTPAGQTQKPRAQAPPVQQPAPQATPVPVEPVPEQVPETVPDTIYEPAPYTPEEPEPYVPRGTRRSIREVKQHNGRFGAGADFIANSNKTNYDVASEYGAGMHVNAELLANSRHALVDAEANAGIGRTRRQGQYTGNEADITRRFVDGEARAFLGRGVGAYGSAGGTIHSTSEDVIFNGEEPSYSTRGVTTKSGRWTAGAGVGTPTNFGYAGYTQELTDRQSVGGNLQGFEAGYRYLGTRNYDNTDFTIKGRKLTGEGVTLVDVNGKLTQRLNDHMRLVLGGQYRTHEIRGINRATNITASIGGEIEF